MDAERWRHISRVFDQLCELPECERSAMLELHCGGDVELRRNVSALLEADAGGRALDMHVPKVCLAVAADWVRDSEALPAGTIIGNWRIQKELGRGGMGMVMLAERVDGQFQQRAALKLIKRGMDSEAVLARFLQERQILARLSHPNIAHLPDGGLSGDGRPYFVMEYIEGAPLIDYCAAHAMDLRGRIGCVLQICAALQFAHRQLVVHLDIKPSNVIVTNAGEVKLLDFGIAKVLDDGSTALLPHTRTQSHRPLTPGYASPEQLLGESVSTATDVYGLGCLLYELLTGHRTHDGAQDPQRALQALAHGEPVAPSKAAAAAPAQSGISPRKLRGDLDTIVMKALKREPERRYPTIDAFAEDLRRCLDERPIAARRDTLVYRMHKLAARNPFSTALVCAAFVGLLGTTTLALSQASRARAEALRAQAVTDYLVDIFKISDPKGTPGGLKLTAREVLDAGAKQIKLQLAQQPQTEASFSIVLGRIYAGLGENDQAIALLKRALLLHPVDEREAMFHSDALALLARAQYESGDYTAASNSSAAASQAHHATGPPDSPMIAQDLALQGEIARRQGEFVKGEALLQQALLMSQAKLRAPDPQIAAQLNQLAALYGDMGQLEQATVLTEKALSMFRALYGENHLDVAENLVNLGVFRMQTDHIAQSLPIFDEAIQIYRRLLPHDHPLHALALANEARAFDRLKRYREAASLYRESVTIQRVVLGNKHPDLATTLNNLAVLLMHLDDFAGSAQSSREAVAIWTAQGKPEHPFALISKAHLAVALRESGDLAEAERITREVLAARRAQLGERNRAVAMSLDDLGIVLRLDGHPDQAVIEQQRAQKIRLELGGIPPPEAAPARVQYALSESAAGDGKSALVEINGAIDALTAMKAPDSEQLVGAFVAKARIEFAQKNFIAGCTNARQALLLSPPDDANTGWRHAEAQSVFGECLAARRQPRAARYQLQTALSTLQHVRGADHWMTRGVRARLHALYKASSSAV